MFSREAWARRIQRGQVLRQTVSGAKQPQRKRRKLPEGDVEPTAAAPMESPPCLDPGQCLTSGDVIKYRRPPWREPIPPTALDVLYEDEHILVVHKPSGLPCMPSQIFESFTVLNILRYSEEPMAQHLGGVNQSPRNPSTTKSERLPLQPVHRLGVGTSGALICAKTRVARRRLSADIRQRKVKKVYRALVTGGNRIPDTLRIGCPIGPVPFPIANGSLNAARPSEVPVDGDGCCDDKKSSLSMSSSFFGTAKPSLSLVRVLKRNPESDTAIVEVIIPTGRPHQIRIHMSFAGFPLVGDPLYLKGGVPSTEMRWFPHADRAARDASTSDEDESVIEDGLTRRVALPRDCGYCLHAYRLEFDNIQGDRVVVIAPPPPQLEV